MILSLIQVKPGISRAELARTCGFSEMAATRIVRELLSAGIIQETAQPEKSKLQKNKTEKNKAGKKSIGRPGTALYIVKDGLFAAGITVSAYHSDVSICDADGKLCAGTRLENVPFESVAKAAQIYGHALRKLIEASNIDIGRVVGIGVALSASTLPEKGEIVKSNYLGWSNDGGQFCREIQKIINLPVEIENISNALALAEMRFGAAREVADFTLIHAATFVGAAMVSEHKLVRGNSGMSGDLGHFRAQRQPLTCMCGRNDCLNLSATGFGLLSQMGKLDHSAFDSANLSLYSGLLHEALGDPKAKDLVAKAGQKLAPALDNVAKLLGPKMIILAGSLGANSCYFNAVHQTLTQNFEYDAQGPFELVKGEISSTEAATLLALHAFCYSDRLDYNRFAPDPIKGATHG